MATFVRELWESIFTPGPTPTLLKAANASFASLQVLLAILLYGTHSIHFAVLSVLCGGLWWAINWFATELRAFQEKEEREKREQEARAQRAAADDSSDTEVDAPSRPSHSVTGTSRATAVEAATAGGADTEAAAAVVQRRGDLAPGTQSSVSTEDEWERVSENEKDK